MAKLGFLLILFRDDKSGMSSHTCSQPSLNRTSKAGKKTNQKNITKWTLFSKQLTNIEC